jgi:hypothetical protein
MKRVTFEQSFSPQIQTLEYAVLIDGLVGIIGTRRKKATVLTE